MRKTKYIFPFLMIHVLAQAVVWHTGDILPMPQVPADSSRADAPALMSLCAEFPRRFCALSGWSPVYTAYGVQEGVLYIGFPGLDARIRTQYHRRMANHEISAAFRILREEHIRAGLKLHYGLSGVRGYARRQAASCSGNVMILPASRWRISMEARHALVFAGADTRIFEPVVCSALSYALSGKISAGLYMSRRQGLPWRTFIQLAWTPFPSLKLAAACECRSGDLRLAAGVRIARWRIDERLRFHPRLGFSHSIFLSYVY